MRFRLRSCWAHSTLTCTLFRAATSTWPLCRTTEQCTRGAQLVRVRWATAPRTTNPNRGSWRGSRARQCPPTWRAGTRTPCWQHPAVSSTHGGRAATALSSASAPYTGADTPISGCRRACCPSRQAGAYARSPAALTTRRCSRVTTCSTRGGKGSLAPWGTVIRRRSGNPGRWTRSAASLLWRSRAGCGTRRPSRRWRSWIAPDLIVITRLLAVPRRQRVTLLMLPKERARRRATKAPPPQTIQKTLPQFLQDGGMTPGRLQLLSNEASDRWRPLTPGRRWQLARLAPTRDVAAPA
mmetsp:Transcript_11599/g.48770  ORF Transcript_11599/g.48770 Transcript_11599/m.48770 type:complete len:296 (+) Transcript_11599:1539-2426(+)